MCVQNFYVLLLLIDLIVYLNLLCSVLEKNFLIGMLNFLVKMIVRWGLMQFWKGLGQYEILKIRFYCDKIYDFGCVQGYFFVVFMISILQFECFDVVIKFVDGCFKFFDGGVFVFGFYFFGFVFFFVFGFEFCSYFEVFFEFFFV